jgi:hypothetical protein
MPTINSGFLLGIIIMLNFHGCTVHELLYQLSKHIHNVHNRLPSPGEFAAQIGLPAASAVQLGCRNYNQGCNFASVSQHGTQVPQIECSIRIMTRGAES